MLAALPQLGVGLGYRAPQHDDIIQNKQHIDFLEVITDQFIYSNEERTLTMLAAAADMPIVPHSLSMSVGTAAPLDEDYLARNVSFLQRVNAPWFSDHLCFTKVPEVDLGSLTPLWFTEEAVECAVANIRTVKAAVPDIPFLVENITYYIPLASNEMSESDFISNILLRADCGLLLDVNNVYINSRNLHFDPYAFLESIPLDRVVQVHIAGYQVTPDLVIDTHGDAVSQEVWDLLSYVVKHSPVKGILLERDENLSPFSNIVEELQHARHIWEAR